MLAYSKNPKMSSILVVSMPVMVLIISLIGRRAMPLSRKMQTRIDRINLIMREKLSGIRVIRAFGTEDYEEKRFDGANKDLMNNAMKNDACHVAVGTVPDTDIKPDRGGASLARGPGESARSL